MKLSAEQKESLLEDGYVRVPAVVPAPPLAAALKAINHSLGQGLPPAEMPVFRSRSFCPELQRAAVILDLLRATPAWVLAESLLGEGGVEPVRSGQIALAFPQTEPAAAPYPHLDGLHTPTNGVPAGEVRSFTLLVGVILSEVTDPGAGNLTVWPGSHRLYESYFREHGPRSLLDGMPPVALPDPVEVTGSVGDVVLCHYQLAHAVGANTSPHVRYAVYFRLKSRGHDGRRWECLTDVWKEWPGVRAR
ncbi:MAG TPA: phytanoyl-CoA dioxygenase family protein [Vicinamibacteria bacterium]